MALRRYGRPTCEVIFTRSSIVGPKPCKSFFVLTKHVNAVSLKLHWTACWKKMRLRPLTLNGNFILQIKTFTNSVFVVFPNYFIGGSIQALCVLRCSAVCTLCSVRKQTRVRFLNSCPEWGSLTIHVALCHLNSSNSTNMAHWHSNFASKFLPFCMC